MAQAAFDSLSDPQRKSNETVPSVVGHVYGFVDSPDTDNGRDRVKRFFVVDSHAGAHLVKDRRRDFGALATEWNKRFCALRDGVAP